MSYQCYSFHTTSVNALKS